MPVLPRAVHGLRRFLLPATKSLSLACALIAAGTAPGADREILPAIDDKWRHYQSPNFELYSRNDELTSRALLENLELLRAIFFERFKFVERARLDVTVYYFRTLADFKAYTKEGMTKNDFFRGFYYGLPDRAVISLAPIDDPEGAQRLVFHEYVHHLYRAAEQDPPVWVNEGMAELFAGIRVMGGGGTVQVGHPPSGRMETLRTEKFLPLETLFGVDNASPIYRSGNHTGMFYAESWALMHYWYFGKSQIPTAAIDRFLKVASSQRALKSVNLRDFFRECFGMDYAEMQRHLESYIQVGSYHYSEQPAPKIAAAKSYPVRVVPRDEIRLRLAELALRVNHSGAAKLVLLEAAEKSPVDPRVFETLGCEALSEHDETTARQRWEQAIDAGTHNVAVYREVGLMESRLWFQRFDYSFRLPAETTQRLRERLLHSIEYEPRQTAAYEMLAWVEGYAEEPSILNVNRVQEVFPVLPHRARTLIALALVRVHLNKPDEANSMLAQLDAVDPDEWAGYAAEVMRARLGGRRPPSRREIPHTLNPAAGAPLKVPSIELPP